MTRLARTMRIVALAALLGTGTVATAPAGDAARQYFPLPTFRVGAYASSGIPVWAGTIDYLRYINEVEGGINGVTLFWDEWVPHGFTPARATVEAKLARPEWKVEIVITAATS